MAEKKKKEKDGKEATASKINIMLIVLIVLGIVLLAGVGAGAYYLGLRSALYAVPASAATPVNKDGKTSSVAANPDRPGPMVPIYEFLINLLDKDDNRYLKATMTLELDSKQAAAEVKEKMPQIRDAILLLTSNKTFGELRDLQGKMQLRAELIGHLNTLLEHGKVKHIYITNFVIQ